MDINLMELIEKLGPWAIIVIPALISAAASILDAMFPQPAEGSLWYYVRKVVSWLAVNIANAKNAR